MAEIALAILSVKLHDLDPFSHLAEYTSIVAQQ